MASYKLTCRGSITLERIKEIIESGLEDCEEAYAGHYTADARSDPGELGTGGPGEHEKAAGEEE